jgi:hypothetical protein
MWNFRSERSDIIALVEPLVKCSIAGKMRPNHSSIVILSTCLDTHTQSVYRPVSRGTQSVCCTQFLDVQDR